MQPISTLHVGTGLFEKRQRDPVEAEPVQAVIKDGVKPLLALQLSDGSAITVTANHPFWLDLAPTAGVGGWIAAGQLRIGDRLRTASGRDVTVTGMRRHVGQAVVYTLTVAKDHTFWGESGPGSGDHTFFVGTAQVLVHNADGPCGLRYEGSPKHHENAGPGIGDAPANGQAALDNSVRVKATSTRRVGVDPHTGQIVVFDETHPGQEIYHGHVRMWDELTLSSRRA